MMNAQGVLHSLEIRIYLTILDDAMNKQTIQLIAISLIAGLLGAAIYNRIQPSTGSNSTSTQIIQERHFVEESDTIAAIEKVVPAVISIVATKDLQVFQQNPADPFFFFENDPFFRDFGFGAPRRQQQQPQQPETRRQQVSGGTGFIIESSGVAITNRHVVADTDADYTAISKEGTVFDVEVVSRDTVNDLAVVQLHVKSEKKSDGKKSFGAKPEKLSVVALGDSTKLKVGQKVLAVGNARGEYENSVTAGIISAIGREIQASDSIGGQAETLSGLIQTDAAINFGNSGGPLVNLAGEVIGVNTAVDQAAASIGFAIPVNQVKPVVESVKKFGRIVRPVLGVIHTMLNKEKAKELKLEGVTEGALIVGDRSKKEFGVVTGSPAEKAGLRIDDVIVEVDGEKVTEDNTLQTIVQRHAPGDVLRLKVWRGGTIFEVSVKLDERK